MVGSCSFVGSFEIVFAVNVNEVLHDLVGHSHVCFCSPFFPCVPLQVVQHGGDAAGVVSVGGIPCSSSLHHFNSLLVVLGVGAPNGAAVVEVRPDDGSVGSGFCVFFG